MFYNINFDFFKTQMGPYTLVVNLSQWTAKFGGPKIKVKANGPGVTT